MLIATPARPVTPLARRRVAVAGGVAVKLGDGKPWEFLLPAVAGFSDDGPVFSYQGLVPGDDLPRANRIAGRVRAILDERSPEDALAAFAWQRDRTRRLAVAVFPVSYHLSADEIGRLLSPDDPEAEADLIDDLDAALGSNVLSELFRTTLRMEISR